MKRKAVEVISFVNYLVKDNVYFFNSFCTS